MTGVLSTKLNMRTLTTILFKPNISPFADNLVNEIWPFLRMLWRTRGGYTAEIHFNPEIDLKEFGNQFGPGMFTAVYKFRISASGSWTAKFTYDYKQIDNPYDMREAAASRQKRPILCTRLFSVCKVTLHCEQEH